MKVPYKQILQYIDSKPSIDELSQKLFQLGHEHQILDEIFDFEFTPNRGDCLSLNGIIRDLKPLLSISNEREIYKEDIKSFPFEFFNDAKDSCTNISFLKIEIDEVPKNYKGSLKDYFTDLDSKRINFFTDVSNYISYETGQPTHCYESMAINEPLRLNLLSKNCEFETLLDKKINIDSGDMVFSDKNNQVINLAGIVGGKNTACKEDTKSVIVECAYFNPEIIIGKSLKYDINSDAAYKFERDTDPYCHNFVLRRFLKIVERHTNIKNVELFSEAYGQIEKKRIPFNFSKINKILGTKVDENKCLMYLKKLGFSPIKNMIEIPSYRNDINSMNDISEEVARVIGYDNIKTEAFKISIKNDSKPNFEENKIKKLLINEGFYEVINNPFVAGNTKQSVEVDNPLDSNRKYLRTNLKDSLLNNLMFNERRQKDSVKLFEISDLYSNIDRKGKRVIGIIASGRIDRNYLYFSKKINNQYIESILKKINFSEYHIEEIHRQSLDTKSKDTIIYCEIEINSSLKLEGSFDDLIIQDINNKQYVPISEFPCSKRDLSFSIKDFSKCKDLEKLILNFKNSLLKEAFVFDYFKNENKNEIKIGFRFIFQSKNSTITDKDVDNVMKIIINSALYDDSISIPGLS
jgi:phenylalanyl-tRNA synthetase beta chain